MNRDQKTALVEELSQEIRSAEAIFAVDYRGISVSDAAELRRRLREAETRFRVVKNSLTERASDQAGAEALKAMLEGPTALAFVTGDAALAAKALSDAARAFGTLAFKGGLMDGSPLTPAEVQSIARLPARDVLYGQLVGTVAAPITQLVRTLNALIAGVAIQLQQMAEQGLVGGTETAPASEAAAAAPEGDEGSEAARAASDADAPPPAEEAAAEEAPAEVAEAPEAEASEAPAEVAEEPAEPATEPQTTSEETDTEASDAEASEE